MNLPLAYNCRGKILNLHQRTHVMGILNVTPDSFSDGGEYVNPEAAIKRGIEIEQEGADILDIGAESTRPGAASISANEELNRLLPVIDGLINKIKIPISVDTYKATVADEVLTRGIHLINDISGLRFDPQLKEVIAKHKACVVIMHIKGTPKNMQQNPHYVDVMREILEYLQDSINMAISAGIKRDQIIIDPGIGFGKRLADNFEILKRLNELNQLQLPILIGPSRKSFIGKILNTEPDQRFEGTAAAVALGIHNGAHIVRVHDIKKNARVCRIADLIVGKTSVTF